MKIYSKEDVIFVLDNVRSVMKTDSYSKVFTLEITYNRDITTSKMTFDNRRTRDDVFNDMLKIMKKW